MRVKVWDLMAESWTTVILDKVECVSWDKLVERSNIELVSGRVVTVSGEDGDRVLSCFEEVQ